MYDCGPQSLELASFFFFPSQVHTWYVVTGLSYKTCGCGYVRVHMLLQCMIECVVFTQSDLPFPLFFYLSLLLCRTVGFGSCLSSKLFQVHASFMHCVYSCVNTASSSVYLCVMARIGEGGKNTWTIYLLQPQFPCVA